MRSSPKRFFYYCMSLIIIVILTGFVRKFFFRIETTAYKTLFWQLTRKVYQVSWLEDHETNLGKRADFAIGRGWSILNANMSWHDWHQLTTEVENSKIRKVLSHWFDQAAEEDAWLFIAHPSLILEINPIFSFSPVDSITCQVFKNRHNDPDDNSKSIFQYAALFLHRRYNFDFKTLSNVYLNRLPCVKKTDGLRVVISTVGDRSLTEHHFFQRSLINRYAYARKHGYELIFYLSTNHERQISWCKINATLRAFRHNVADWVFWQDADVLIMNHSIRVESFLSDQDDYDVIISKDCNDLNTGLVLIRNSAWSIAFLEKVYASPWALYASLWRDQAAMIYWYNNSVSDRRHFKIIPQRQINSYPPGTCETADAPSGSYQPGDFIFHMPGRPPEMKNRLIDKYADEAKRLNGYIE